MDLDILQIMIILRFLPLYVAIAVHVKLVLIITTVDWLPLRGPDPK